MSRPNDARLWALMLTPLHAAGISVDAERVARQLVALVRSERDSSRRTFAPGEEATGATTGAGVRPGRRRLGAPVRRPWLLPHEPGRPRPVRQQRP